jgi:hypothetical protein
MKHSSIVTAVFAVILTTGALLSAAPASAELRVVDGKLWKASSIDEKRAYLIGVANTVAVTRALNARHGGDDPAGAIGRIDTALDAGTINLAVEQVDDWYEANPSREDAPVLGVIWMKLVTRQ